LNHRHIEFATLQTEKEKQTEQLSTLHKEVAELRAQTTQVETFLQITHSKLDFRNRTAIDDEQFKVMLQKMTSFKKLNLKGCSNVSNCSIKLLADKQTALAKLNLSDCPQITDEAIDYLVKRCTSLKTIVLDHMFRLKPETRNLPKPSLKIHLGSCCCCSSHYPRYSHCPYFRCLFSRPAERWAVGV